MDMIDAASDLASLFCYFWGIIPQAKVPKSKAQTDRSFQPDCPASQRIRLLVHLGSWLGRCDCVALHRLCSMPRPLLAERRYTPITNVLLHTNNLYLPCNDQWPTVSKFCRSTKALFGTHSPPHHFCEKWAVPRNFYFYICAKMALKRIAFLSTNLTFPTTSKVELEPQKD